MASSWVALLEWGNTYVLAKGGLALGKPFLRLNYLAARDLAKKYAKDLDLSGDDSKQMVLLGSGAVVGGQAAWFAYRDYAAKKKVAPETPKGASNGTGTATDGAARQQNGVARIVAVPSPNRPADAPAVDQYG